MAVAPLLAEGVAAATHEVEAWTMRGLGSV